MTARRNKHRKARARRRLAQWRLEVPVRQYKAAKAALEANQRHIEAGIRRRAEEAKARAALLALCPMEEHIKAQSIPDLRKLQREWFEVLGRDPYGRVWFQPYDPRRFSRHGSLDHEPLNYVTKPLTEALQFLSEELERRMSGSLVW